MSIVITAASIKLIEKKEIEINTSSFKRGVIQHGRVFHNKVMKPFLQQFNDIYGTSFASKMDKIPVMKPWGDAMDNEDGYWASGFDCDFQASLVSKASSVPNDFRMDMMLSRLYNQILKIKGVDVISKPKSCTITMTVSEQNRHTKSRYTFSSSIFTIPNEMLELQEKGECEVFLSTTFDEEQAQIWINALEKEV